MSILRRLFGARKKNSLSKVAPMPRNPVQRSVAENFRSCRMETMEVRQVLSANPLVVGAVYIEGDGGTDAQPDQFYIAFEGGSDSTSVTRVVIDGNQDGVPGLGDTDVYFDVTQNNVGGNNEGVGGAHDFQWSADSSGISATEVTATVADGGTRLVLDLVGFEAGDVLAFTIDVDQYFATKPHDQVTSGIEFAGSSLEVSFADPSYNFSPDPSQTIGTFEYNFDFGSDDVADSGTLSMLPSQDNRLASNGSNSIENRTAGAREDFLLTPKPVSISGYVSLSDQYGNCVDPTSSSHVGVDGVLITATDEFGNQHRTTTNADGFYEFTNLDPGTYTVEESQPSHLLDGDESVGEVNGITTGSTGGNDRFVNVTLGPGEDAVHYNFCEHLPAAIEGTVYYDQNNNGAQDAGEDGISGVEIELFDQAGNSVATILTDINGDYSFEMLAAGIYSVHETQPAAFLDGIDSLGTVNGVLTGSQQNDRFHQIELKPGNRGINYDFGEIRQAIIEGVVHTDLNGNCIYEPGDETLLDGVRMQLLDSSGNVISETSTDSQGRYRFDGLRPGEYSVRQVQPGNFFTAGEVVGRFNYTGSAGDGTTSENLISDITIFSGAHMIDYNFCEAPAAVISGYVFQDGSTIVLGEGETLTPAQAANLRDGQLTADDTRLAGVVLELRNGITGEPIPGDQALAGAYGTGAIQTVTDANGYYEFTGLRQGNYAIFEVQPAGYQDHLDTAGTNSGIPVNPTDGVDPFILSTLSAGVDPANDAILRIAVNWGDHAQLNNFSEIVTATEELPPPPLVFPPPSYPVISQVGPKFVVPVGVSGGGTTTPQVQIGGLSAPPAEGGYSWHLSIINAGSPRGNSEGDLQWNDVAYLSQTEWDGVDLNSGSWIISQQQIGEFGRTPATSQVTFGMPGGIPLAGDFNGDGTDELLIYNDGHWFVDINGNQAWDGQDLWAKLGSNRDIPVVGDWDGDGKDDIGIYGPQWANDPRAIDVDPGLPDLANELATDVKNIPPNPEDAAAGERRLKRPADKIARMDVIDHVFRFGTEQDVPVTGDWNGDGIRNIGVFQAGTWKLDADGDGRLTPNDVVVEFGEAGDIPVVGDFNGDGVEQIGVFRGGVWTIDSNGNGELEVTDKVFELGTAGDIPVVGDFDGDGVDEPAVYQRTGTTNTGLPFRKAG